MAPKLALLLAALCAVALSGCTAGDDGGDSETTTTTGGVGIGGNATVGNTTISGSYTASGTYDPGNATNNATAPMAQSVSIEGGRFVNDTVTVRVGGTVTWTHNDGAAKHTVTATDGSFDSHPDCEATVGPLPPTGDCMDQGETFSVTFATAGEFSYTCRLTGITGTVKVVA